MSLRENKSLPTVFVGKYVYKHWCTYLREHKYLPTIYLLANPCRQVLATSTCRLLVASRSQLELRSAFRALARKIGSLRTTLAKSPSRSQYIEAKAARARSQEALTDLAAASGRTSTCRSTCARTCVSTSICRQVLVGKYVSTSTCRQVLVQVPVQVLARTHVLAHTYFSTSTCRQVRATSTCRLLVASRSPLVLSSAVRAVARKIGSLVTTLGKSTSRSQDSEAKAARARSREALTDLAAAYGRTSSCRHVLVQVLA
jgi:hypothetical protein